MRSGPNGGPAQPTSIWPDITCVSVDGGLPVATGLALRSNCLMKAATTAFVDAPLVEYAMVLPSVSRNDRTGESDRTYQNRSPPPFISAPMMRNGAPFAKAPNAPKAPADTPSSTLPEITACWVSPPP